MRNSVAVPAFGEHAYTDNAANVSARRILMWSLQLFREFDEPLRVDGPALRVHKPRRLPDRVEGEPHPCVLVALGLPGVGLVHDLRVDADRRLRAAFVAKARDPNRRNARVWALVFCKPFVDYLGDFHVLADDDENRGPRVISMRGPFLSELRPKPA